MPTAFAVDGSGIYVSLGRSTWRLQLDGSNAKHLFNTASDVIGLVIAGDFLYVNSGDGHFSSANKNTGAVVASQDFWTGVTGLSIDTTHNKIFGRSTGISPSDIFQVGITENGGFGNLTDSPYHGDYPDAQRTFVFPDKSKVADNSGIVYDTIGLTYLNSLNGAFADLAFAGNTPVVLRDGALIAYSKAFLETGRFQLEGSPLRIFTANESVFAFYQGSPRGVWATRVPLELLNPESPGEPVNPEGLAYTPDSFALGADNVLYLLSRGNSSIFRWSVTERRYLPTIPLLESPQFMALSDTNRALYLAYASGKITVIHLDQNLTEAPFVNLPQAPIGLSTAGQFLFAADPSGAWGTHYVFSADGELISSKDWNYYSSEYIWSEENRKMYFFRDDTSPNDLLSENIDLEGNLGAEAETPYHSSDGIKHPIRVAPDGSYVLLGSGRIFHPITLAHIDSLSNDIGDAAWLEGGLFTMRELNGATQLQAWTNTYGVAKTASVVGTPHRLFATAQSLVAITDVDGRPIFTILDPQLRSVYQSPLPSLPLVNISTRLHVGTGDNVLISGFIITGSESKKILLRGIGPSLEKEGVSAPLQDPMLELYSQTGALIAANRNWQSSQHFEIESTGIPPGDPREAAMVQTLAPGVYSFALSGENGTTGVGLIEAYDLSVGTKSTLANISTRGHVARDENVMIAGFIVSGESGRTATALVRGIGPSLAQQNVTGALQNPALELRDRNGTVVRTNDNWKRTQRQEIERLGVAPSDDREAALVQTLPPGDYTVILKGVANTTGVGLLEVYNVQ